MQRAISLGARGDTSRMRETLSAQQELLHKLRLELDAEREASATATSEALSMILRLQGEKAGLQMEASQYKRMAEEKMCHAETSLALFENLIYHKDMEIASLEFQVQAYRCKLLSLGCTDPAALGNKFPENLMIIGEPSAAAAAAAGTHKRKITRVLSSPFHGMNNDRTPLVSDIEGTEDMNNDRTPILSDIEGTEEMKTENLDEKKTGGGDLKAYWEEMKRIEEHVREISDSRDPLKENKLSLLRRESMCDAQVSNSILETAKSDLSYIMEKMKKADRVPGRDASADIFEIPQMKRKGSLAVVLEEGELKEKKGWKMKELERRGSKPLRSMSFKTEAEYVSLFKEMREELNVMQSEIRRLRSEWGKFAEPQEDDRGVEAVDDGVIQSLKEAMIYFWL